MNRRNFLEGAAFGVAAAAVPSVSLARIPEAEVRDSAETAPPRTPSAGRPYNPVVTLNGWTAPFRMRDGVKEFHLIAEPVEREIAPGMVARLWGYNGQSPGPTIEVVEGDRVRLYVTNHLPEPTTIHWHGQRLPNGMDGVAGLNQKAIGVGKTFVYEFVARRPGTFMYHPHADEMVQMAMGMMGSWVTHPRSKHDWIDDAQRDYCILLNAYDVDPGSMVPKVNEMLDFNLWTFNSRAFPGLDPLVARLGDRVRIRVGNLTMTSHPIHLHGHEFEVTGTDGGPTPPGSRWREVTTNVAVGQMRQVDFIADAEGDWAFHCHKSHHTMNPMGHDVPTMIGVDHRGINGRIQKLVPDYMVMGERGMNDMKDMPMMLPEETLAMMAGHGPHGPIGMGGMFTWLAVRHDQPRGDYRVPKPYQQPPGTQAWEYTGDLPDAARFAAERENPGGVPDLEEPALRMDVRKPSGGHQH